MEDTKKGMELLLSQVEKQMKRMIRGAAKDKLTGPVLKTALSGRGKFLRPQLLILSAYLVDEEAAERHKKELVHWGALIELAHTASLIHDDVIDESPTRRGKPTVMKSHGNSAAVYAGDYLLVCILREILQRREEERALSLTDSIEEMCIGEINQTRCKYRADMTVEQYDRNIAGKTGVLFSAACQIGVIHVTEEKAVVDRYTLLGRKLGRAFQLRDDLLDVVSFASETGKPVMQDFREGIYTKPVLLAREHSQYGNKVRALMKKSRKGTLTAQDVGELRKILEESGAICMVRDEVNELIEFCKKIIAESKCMWAQDVVSAMLEKLKMK